MLQNRTENEPEKENILKKANTTTSLDVQLPQKIKHSDAEKIESNNIDALAKGVLNAEPVIEKSRCKVNETHETKSEQNVEISDDDLRGPHARDWTLSDFEIQHRLGHGRFGKVYSVREKSTNRIYAMKKQSHSPTNDVMIYREIEIQACLCHKNIVRLYGYFQRNCQMFLILEFAPNGNLRQKVRKLPDKRCDEKSAARYIFAIVDALTYLHENDIIHRDIKPENMLLGINDELKLADFGLAVYQENQQRRTICGTPHYQAPEIMNGEPYSKEVDLWSLGILCYDILIGEWPFEAETTAEMYWKTVKANYNPFPEFLSKHAGHLIRRLITVGPERRLPLRLIKKHPWIVANAQ